MKAIINDVNNSFEGRLEVVDVLPSKEAYCEKLRCKRCHMIKRNVMGKQYGFVIPDKWEDRGWGYVSMINTTSAPDFEGGYLVFGLNKDGNLRSLYSSEVRFLKEQFIFDKRENGRGKYVLMGVD